MENYEKDEELLEEWIHLMKLAQSLGRSKEEIVQFLEQNKRNKKEIPQNQK